ncbi:MAG: right-handed parallel beta-helix repeat-containing protein, partial [Planctomycetota bacterium]
MRRALLALVLCSAPVAAGAARQARVSNAAGLRMALQAIQPGDSILVEPGEYRGSFRLAGHRATAERPTVIAAANPDKPPVLQGASVCLHLSNVSHVTLRDLVLAGARVNGLNIDDGGDYASPSRRIILDGLTVRDVGSRGNQDGIKLSGVDDVLVRGCAVERWGGGGSGIDMVGCHGVLIVDCTFRHRRGRGGHGVQAKGGSANVAIYRNRFEHAGQRAVNLGGSTGRAYFRPKDPGYEARRIAVLGNVFVGSMAPVAYVGCDQGLVSHNTIYRPTRWAVRILQESTGEAFVPCRKGVFRHNLVVWRKGDLATTVNVGPHTTPQTFRFEGNWW